MQRRKLLVLAGGSLAVTLGGCLGGDDDDGNGTENGDDNGTVNGDENGDEQAAAELFEATSTGGIIWIGEDDEADAREDALGFPPSEAVPEPLEIDADIDGDSWESTRVEFPDLDVSDLVPPEFEAFDVGIGISAPEGFTGTFEPETGEMTMEGTLSVDIMLDGDHYPVQTEIAATTGESGVLEGSFDAGDETHSVMLVENEAIIDDETESNLINDFLGLPEEDPMWMELEMDIVTE